VQPVNYLCKLNDPMKKIILLLAGGFIAAGCTDTKLQERAALDTVMQAHEKVMGEDESLMKNKLLLDSLAKQDTTALLKDSIMMYSTQVTNADSSMANWMHNFDPDMTGKLPDERMIYLHTQKKLIFKVDSQITSALNTSDKFLKKMKMK
jgi:hypothetical protein